MDVGAGCESGGSLFWGKISLWLCHELIPIFMSMSEYTDVNCRACSPYEEFLHCRTSQQRRFEVEVQVRDIMAILLL